MTHERRFRHLTGLAAGFAILAVSFAASACRREAPPPPAEAVPAVPATPAAAHAAPPVVDQAMDARLAFMAGLPATNGPYARWEGEPAWQDFAKSVDAAWASYAASVLKPLESWAGADLAQPRERTQTLFYPFGGPDLTTAVALFPEAPVTVLIGLEPVGNLPELDRMSVEGRAEYFADLGTLTLQFLSHGYFITMDMLDVYSKGHVDGALAAVGFFLKRCGFSVVEIRRLLPAADGSWQETPYARLTARTRRPYGVRIDYVRPGDATLRTVYYFSCDVENKSFLEGSPLYRFFDGLERPTTFIKAGSYLLHWGDFSTLRRLILDRSVYVLQDDTAVPYRFFKREGWAITLFGRYTHPVKDFSNVDQPDLQAAYEDAESDVRPLPFHFGYRWRTQVENLLLAERPHRAYKVPVRK